jgi:hypothetical protein
MEGYSLMQNQQKITDSSRIPHIPLPFKEVMADALRKAARKAIKKKSKQQSALHHLRGSYSQRTLK